MQNYYIRIEDMPSLISHQLSIIEYVVLKKIFFFLCFDRLIWTWTWLGLEPLWTRTWLGLEPLWTRSWLGLEPLWTWTCFGLDKGGLDYSPSSKFPVRGRFRCGAIENTVCTVCKPLRLWRVPVNHNNLCVCVCVCVCVYCDFVDCEYYLHKSNLLILILSPR